MYRRLLRMVHFVALLLLGVAGAAVSAAPSVLPEVLRCEYRTDPLGVDEPAPRLSWQIRSPRRGERQTAYQVVVSSSPEGLKREGGDLWDSGKVSSERSAGVVYQGKALASGTRCFWKVRVWDAEGRPSAYSRPASWEMGLLQAADWQAKWIGLPVAGADVRLVGTPWVWYPEGNPTASAPAGTRYFRRVLSLSDEQKVTRAQFLVAVDNEFVLYVNGKEAGRGGGWQGAHRMDVAPLLKKGDNVLAIAATNADGPAGLLGHLKVELERGAPLELDVDRMWKTFNREQEGWKGASFNDGDWPGAREIAKLGDMPWGAVSTGGGAAPSPYLRKEFALEGPVRRARLYATALGVYQLWLNGSRVSQDILSPGWTDYRKRGQYQTYDVTALLKRGPNALGAILGDGWYAGSLGFDLSRNHFGPSPPRLRMQLAVEYKDGSAASVITDESWKGSPGPILEADNYGGETYDARLEMPGWDRPGFREEGLPSERVGGQGIRSSWQPVSLFTDPNPPLNAQSDPPIQVTEELKPEGVTEPKPGVYVFDMGQNMVGWARLKVKGPAGTRVTLRFAEVLNPDGTVYRENLRRARATDAYILKGQGEETWEPHFTYHGFRYVEVTGYPGVPEQNALLGRVFHSAMRATSRFQCSSEMVNRLYRNVTWGQRSNLMSVPTDCPQRDERLGWMGDAQLFARTSCWNMDMAAFYTKWMRDIVDAQSAEGAFSDVSPRVVDPADGAPAWAEAGVVIPWTVYECYGDTRILERNYGAIRRYVDLIHAANPNLLWLKRRNNDFGDWVPAGEQTNKDLIASAYFAYDTRLLSRMARAIGRKEDAETYARLADRIAAAFNERFLSPEGVYLGDTQTAYAMALGMDLVPPERRAQVGDRLAKAVQRRGNALGTGFIGTKFLLPALSDTGHDDVAYQLLTNTRYPSWGYMIGKGATTVWELWNSDTEGPGMNSRNHFAFGTVAEWMQRYLCGIDVDPAMLGYTHFLIHPRPGGDLTFARGEYDSLYGTIISEWTADGDLSVTIPANTAATVYVPRVLQDSEISEGGKPVWKDGKLVPGVTGITSGARRGSAVALEVGSGHYTFQVKP
jgi:alpha-L-rhamnosidase